MQTFIVLNASHPSTAGLPARWRYADEVYSRKLGRSKCISLFVRYNFDSDPRKLGAIVVLAVDDSSYEGELRDPLLVPRDSILTIAM
jgi:hypothetical protein